MTLSIVIPTFNNEASLHTCLSSIARQRYSKNDMEIIIADGGSTDSTLVIARKYGCRIIKNPKRLAEYGVDLGFRYAKGEIVVVLASDNELKGFHYISSITLPFSKDPKIVLTYPKQESGPKDTWISRYTNTFTDPISHFIYWSASNTRTFSHYYSVIKENETYIVYDFSPKNFPLIALAQGTAVRKSVYYTYQKEGDDILPIISMIEGGEWLAYVKNAAVYHHTTASLAQFIKKQRWAFDNYFFHKGYGSRAYGAYFSLSRKIRKIVWPLYAVSIVGPIVVAGYHYVASGNRVWLYHPFLTYVTFYCLVTEFIRVIICKDTRHIQRI